MGKNISGIGVIFLLVVMAIVLLLVAKAWKGMAPEAIEVTVPQFSGTTTASPDSKAPAVEGAGRLPDLNEMRKSTDQHSHQVQEIQDQIDR